MIGMVWDITHGRKPTQSVPVEVNEFFMAKEFQGWTLEYIRSLNPRDYVIFSSLSSVYNKAKAKAESGGMAREAATQKVIKQVAQSETPARNAETNKVLRTLS